FSPASGFIADRLNSDANVVTGMTELFTLLPGQQNTDIDAGIISVSISTLPLHRFQLTGRLSGRNVTLKWVAENELGTENFVIERSVNGTTYDAIALMQPTGPLNVPTEYFHSDENLGLSLDNIIYYRIKAMDREGRFAYSNVVIIRANKNAGMKIWPNPVTDFVNITYIAPATTTIDVSILNSLGKTVRQSGYAVSRGLNQVSVNDLKDLSSGIYFIRIANKNANEVYVQKISK
ncbi:MAG: T9SS type A sorting domain-containing protein, partial [Chitinophagaceae bacterium]